MSPNATALVVSGDLERLSRWATWLKEEGFDTVGCPGPEIRNRCPRADGMSCPLREVVDVAVVDAPSLDPDAPERLCTKLADDYRTIFLGPEGMEVTFANGAGRLRASDPVGGGSHPPRQTCDGPVERTSFARGRPGYRRVDFIWCSDSAGEPAGRAWTRSGASPRSSPKATPWPSPVPASPRARASRPSVARMGSGGGSIPNASAASEDCSKRPWPGRIALGSSSPTSARGFAHARPNPGHRAIAALDRHGLVRTVITQNVDWLHQDAGASSMIELHGSFRRNVCVSCGAVEHITREQLLRDFDHISRGLRSPFIPSLLSLFPKCAVCGGPMRPDFVAFGEPIRDQAPAATAASACRSMLVVGTSGVVFPAGELPQRARTAGAPVILITDGPSAVQADITLLGDASKLLPAIVERVLAVSGSPREGTG